MRVFWHPVSAIYLAQPRAPISPAIVRLVLAGEGRATILYAGDRMWPALRHGQSLDVFPLATGSPTAGDLVLTVRNGVPDVMRVTGMTSVAADADPSPPHPIAGGDLIGRIEPAKRRRSRFPVLARAILDLREAVAHHPDPARDPAQTVRTKYDGQAVHYGRLDGDAIDSALASRLRAAVPPGGRVLVAGSGAGREAFALEQMGYEVTGVDFSERMVEVACAEASRRGSRVRFTAGDLRSYEELDGSLAAVLFTYDVYSFLPGARTRIDLLARLSRWLRPAGALFLSARGERGLWDRVMLSLQWAARLVRGAPGAWGDTHTRWLDGSGELRRSFVHVFTDASLDREAAAAGFRLVAREGGHGLYVAKEAGR